MSPKTKVRDMAGLNVNLAKEMVNANDGRGGGSRGAGSREQRNWSAPTRSTDLDPWQEQNRLEDLSSCTHLFSWLLRTEDGSRSGAVAVIWPGWPEEFTIMV